MRAFAAVAALLTPARAFAVALTGTVSWAEPQPVPEIFPVRDRHVCGTSGPIFDRHVDVDARGRLAGAVVYLDGLPRDPKLRPRAVAFDQQNCMFVPHVAVTTRGSAVQITSSDPVLHNVHITDAAGKTVANYAMPVMGQKASFKATVPGEFHLRCEAGHGWMNAWLRVFDHGFFTVTGPDGTYRLSGVPPGRHTVVAWHPSIGRASGTIVAGGADVALDLVLTSSRAAGAP